MPEYADLIVDAKLVVERATERAADMLEGGVGVRQDAKDSAEFALAAKNAAGALLSLEQAKKTSEANDRRGR